VGAADITLIASGDDIAAKPALWIGHTRTGEYARRSLTRSPPRSTDRGEYAILGEQGL
jgi:hypothetical protein